MNRFAQVFKCCQHHRMAIIGMVHVRALPMSPMNTLSVDQLIEISCHETEVYKKHGLDGICVENMFDRPYVRSQHSGPEVTACMTRICAEVKRSAGSIPVGVQVLAGLNREALAVCLASGLQFIRCESYVFGHIADEGYMDGCAGPLARYRNQLNANNVLILTDIKKKHSSHAITADVDVLETAKAAEFFLSDGVIVTGSRTGDLPDVGVVDSIKKSGVRLPVIIGSGVSDVNVKSCVDVKTDAVIIG
ncbi:unnamed protein product, partial [Oppiella nova]